MTIYGREGPGVPWLTPEAPYKLVLPIPEDPASNITGLRAIDRATLARDQALVRPFRASAATGERTLEPAVDFCVDVLPLFVAKCSSTRCHGPNGASAGLALSSHSVVQTTAINRIAQGASVAGRRDTPGSGASSFGTNMPLIKPGDPGSSWLLYKTELAAPAESEAARTTEAPCAPSPAPAADYAPPVSAFASLALGERARLGDFILGQPMPHALSAWPGAPDPASLPTFPTPLTFQERERLRLWIAQGAETRECSACPR